MFGGDVRSDTIDGMICSPRVHRFQANRSILSIAVSLVLHICLPGCADRNVPTAAPQPSNGRDAAESKGDVTETSLVRHPSRIALKNVTESVGVDFRHTDGSCGRHYILEAMTGGLALFDYDSDGLIDIYFLNGASLLGTQVERAPTNALYRNEGNWEFTDVTEQAGVGHTGFGLGVTVGDYDSDGDPDLYVNNYGSNVLFRNNGDGTFSDATSEASVGGGGLAGAGACFLDIEKDGDLDLYVSNYVQFSSQTHKARFVGDVPRYPGPLDQPAETDQLFRNNGDGTFTDVSIESGVAQRAATGMGMICSDYDNDGDTDIFVANDVMANWLFENDGHGKFKDVAIAGGTAYDDAGIPQSSMGVDCADFDNDGWLDFHVTSYQNELAALYRNMGNGFFHHATQMTGAGQGTLHHVTWGNGFVDFDNDGDRDLFIACGHTEDNIERWDQNGSYMARNVLLMNTGTGQFVDVSDACGDGLAVKLCSRGAAFDDLDNDGRVDAVILNSRREPTILRNETETNYHWIQVELQGTRSDRDGVGAHVKVTADDLVQVAEVHSGRGYQSHYGTLLHFGLEKHERVDQIEIRWIAGGIDVVENVAADQRMTIIESLGDL